MHTLRDVRLQAIVNSFFDRAIKTTPSIPKPITPEILFPDINNVWTHQIKQCNGYINNQLGQDQHFYLMKNKARGPILFK